jgi:hypothetical protein
LTTPLVAVRSTTTANVRTACHQVARAGARPVWSGTSPVNTHTGTCCCCIAATPLAVRSTHPPHTRWVNQQVSRPSAGPCSGQSKMPNPSGPTLGAPPECFCPLPYNGTSWYRGHCSPPVSTPDMWNPVSAIHQCVVCVCKGIPHTTHPTPHTLPHKGLRRPLDKQAGRPTPSTPRPHPLLQVGSHHITPTTPTPVSVHQPGAPSTCCCRCCWLPTRTRQHWQTPQQLLTAGGGCSPACAALPARGAAAPAAGLA